MLTAAILLAACSSDPAEPAAPAPVITITGVEDGATYTEPLTITIAVDVGTYTATLNGEPFLSGNSVSDVGTYALVVDAENQGSRSNEQLTFFLTLSGDRIMIIRMLDLGDNEDLGGGDAILVADSSSAGLSYALIDAGARGQGAADSMYVAQRLTELGVQSLEALILTHGHADHYYGIPSVYDNRPVRRFFWNSQQSRDGRYGATIGIAAVLADTVFTVDETIIRGLADPGSPVITVLSPFPAFIPVQTPSDAMIDEGTLGVQIAFGEFSIFLAGDGLGEANNRWRNSFPSVSVENEVLKVGHHGGADAIFNNGSDGASTWLDHTSPRLALISANGGTHPDQTTLDELTRRGIVTYCTNTHGEITLRANNQGQFLVAVERNSGQPCSVGG